MAEKADETWNLHGQATSVTQWHGAFNAPYRGQQSLQANEPKMETVDLTLFLGVRLWNGGAFYLNPEIDEGYGLSSTLGIAGYPSGESYKLGHWAPYAKLQRAFIRQTVDLGGAATTIESGPNSLGGATTESNLVLTAGKFSIVDLFDTNPYAHDPKGDFLNWSIIDGGAFDYAGDAWGYTYGGAAEWNAHDWTLRGGFFALSTMPGSTQADASFNQNTVVAEVEHRHDWLSHPGQLKLLWFVNRGRMGSYSDAVNLAAATGQSADVSAVRSFRNKTGYVLNLAQELPGGVGVFARYSKNDGKSESFDFTDINQSISLGVSVAGHSWGRPDDHFGLAGAINGLSNSARAYFAAGGTGLLIGDGQLPHYGREQIVESYYSIRLHEHFTAAFNYQYVKNPAYNPDRGPVSIYGVRFHADF